MKFYLTKVVEFVAPIVLLPLQLLLIPIWLYCKTIDTQYATIWEERIIALDATVWVDRLYMPIALQVLSEKLYERYGGARCCYSFDSAVASMMSNKHAFDDWSRVFNRMSPLAQIRILRDLGLFHDITKDEWNWLLHPDNPIYDEVDVRTQVLMGNPIQIAELYYYQDHLRNLAHLDKEALL